MYDISGSSSGSRSSSSLVYFSSSSCCSSRYIEVVVIRNNNYYARCFCFVMYARTYVVVTQIFGDFSRRVNYENYIYSFFLPIQLQYCKVNKPYSASSKQSNVSVTSSQQQYASCVAYPNNLSCDANQPPFMHMLLVPGRAASVAFSSERGNTLQVMFLSVS